MKFYGAAELGVTNVSNWMKFRGQEHEKIMKFFPPIGEKVIPAQTDSEPLQRLADYLAATPPTMWKKLKLAKCCATPLVVTAM